MIYIIKLHAVGMTLWYFVIKSDLTWNVFTSQVDNQEEEYRTSCLLMVFLAVSIPLLARDEKSLYDAQLVAHGNNCHTMARAINHVAAALFTVLHGNIEERLKEFLAVISLLYTFQPLKVIHVAAAGGLTNHITVSRVP